MKPAIRVENLSKSYQLGSRSLQAYRTLREALQEAIAAPARWLRRSGRSRPSRPADANLVNALANVSFEIKPGEVVGIIGRNGAGKSTMLKVLSRVTEPSAGRVELRGRVGSLLEVGAGFHLELTGRENIYLYGAILGMKRSEIARKFDDIVAFAEVSRFLDTPVKRYSSGMYMRLAFAVAAHLEPEILLVDEVLAVGDVSFQRKCIKKMHDVGQGGRTVLVISHDLAAITRLCPRVILLDAGTVVMDGSASEVVKTYLNSGFGMAALREWPNTLQAPGNDVVRLHAVRVRTRDTDLANTVDIRRPTFVDMEYEVLRSGRVLMPNYHLFNEEGICLCVVHDLDPAWRDRPRRMGRYVSTMCIPGNFLAEGTFILSAALTTYVPFQVHCFVRDAVAFQVVDSIDGDSARGDFAGRMPGVVRPMWNWRTRYLDDAPKAVNLIEEDAVCI